MSCINYVIAISVLTGTCESLVHNPRTWCPKAVKLQTAKFREVLEALGRLGLIMSYSVHKIRVHMPLIGVKANEEPHPGQKQRPQS